MGKEQLEIYDKITSNFNKAHTKRFRKDGIDCETQNIEKTVKNLGDEMESALINDRAANEKKRPAFERLKMLNTIEITLSKINLHEEFLEKEGCQRLADWLKPLPDNTYPNQKIVHIILSCIDRLPVSQDHLKDCDLESSLCIYKDGDIGQSYLECKRLSKCILDKWHRDKYSIETTYDAAGNFDEGWRKFQTNLTTERKRQKVDENASEPHMGHFLSSNER
jgi:hypothetical protein